MQGLVRLSLNPCTMMPLGAKLTSDEAGRFSRFCMHDTMLSSLCGVSNCLNLSSNVLTHKDCTEPGGKSLGPNAEF